MSLKIHNDDADELPVADKPAAKPKPRRLLKKIKSRKQPTAEVPQPRPYVVVICTLGKPPRMETHVDLRSLAVAIRAELRASLPEDVRVFVLKGEQLTVTMADDNLKWVDGEQSAVLRLPLPAAEVDVIKVTGELFASDDIDMPDAAASAAGSDDDFLFA